ncbi:MAG: spore germination protein GerW family protein, partial [Anaerolineae bacterium]
METDIDRLLASFVEMRREANVNACFGEPVTLEGRTVIPVAKTTYGFGMGAGRGPTTEADEGIRDADKIGPGAGGGARSSPLGVIEVTSQGARYESVVDRQR